MISVHVDVNWPAYPCIPLLVNTLMGPYWYHWFFTNLNNFSPGSGVTVIGKFDILYGTVTVDKLMMWNCALSPIEVTQLYDMLTE